MLRAVVLAGLGASPYGTAATIYVDAATGNDAWTGLCAEWDGGTCGPKATIQAGIDAAADGDAVVLADGVYRGIGNRDLDCHGRSITVCSSTADPTHCVIDCQGAGRGFNFHDGETAACQVRGLTIHSGYANAGGGVLCRDGSSPTLSDCLITRNTAYDDGGGVCCTTGAHPTLTNCVLTGNVASYSGGAVACLDNAGPTLVACTIAGNLAYDGSGGGVACRVFSHPTLLRCSITENFAGYSGGGVSCHDESHPTLVACTIAGNTAEYAGGVSCYYGSSPVLTSCALAGNAAHDDGGLTCHDGSNPALTTCTIIGNRAEFGGGLACHLSSPTVANCILWANAPAAVYVAAAEPVVTYCDVQGGWPGEGNFDSDPLHVDPDGPDGDPTTWEDNDYHLAAGSPCIDAGEPGFVAEPGGTDIEGRCRVWDGDGDGAVRVDLGGFEYGSHRFGDLNCDDACDAFDIDPFVLALADADAYQAAYPACDVRLADVNSDGAVDAFDIDALAGLLAAGARARAAVLECRLRHGGHEAIKRLFRGR